MWKSMPVNNPCEIGGASNSKANYFIPTGIPCKCFFMSYNAMLHTPKYGTEP